MDRFGHIDGSIVRAEASFSGDGRPSAARVVVRFYAWWEHPLFLAREADAGWRFTDADAGAREMLVEAEEPLRFEVRAGDSATEMAFYTEHPDLWGYEDQGQIFCNSAFDPEELLGALLQEGLPKVDREVLLRYLSARPKDPPFCIAGLPCTLFHPVRKHLRRTGVDVFTPREPEARISPVMLKVDDNVLVVARDFHVDVPEFEHRPEWFESEQSR
jgi:hypothetical protein